MKKHPVTRISIMALAVLAACLTVSAFNYGQQYHAAQSVLTAVDMEPTAAVRAAIIMERANLHAVMEAVAAVLTVYLIWWLACAYVIIRRLRAAGLSCGAERYCLSLLPFVACGWWVHLLLDSRPAAYHYGEYMQCLSAAMGAACCGVLSSVVVLYVICHLPWKRRWQTQDIIADRKIN